MPRGPKGEGRPADVNARALMIGKIAPGEMEDKVTDDGKNAAAVGLGSMGGKARACGYVGAQAEGNGRKAAESRWKSR